MLGCIHRWALCHTSAASASRPLTKEYTVLMQTLHFAALNVPSPRPHVALTRLPSRKPSAHHTHDFHEIFLVTGGSGLHHINRTRLELTTGHLAVIQPTDCHHFTSRRGDELSILNVAIRSAWWKQFHLLMGSSIPQDWFQQGTPRGHMRLEPAVLKTIRPVLEHLAGQGTRPPSDLVDALVQVIHLFLPQEHPARPPAWLEHWNARLSDARETLCEPLEYWQKQCGRSPEHLARSCRTFFGLTPTDLLNRARIERAKTLLSSTDDKVVSVGFACGFGNLSNFYRNFQTHTGMTPTAWRRRQSAAIPPGP